MKQYSYKINGKDYNVTIADIQGHTATVNVNGTDYSVELPEAVLAPAPAAAAPAAAATSAAPAAAPAPAGGANVVAPLPGTVLTINVKVGDVVKAADTVIVLEAMKMENAIPAGRDGKVTAIKVNQGDSVLEGDALITLA